MAVRDDFAAGEVLAAADLNDTFASKLPYSYGTATPSTTDSGFLWYDSNSTPPVPKYWNGSSFATLAPAPGLELVTAESFSAVSSVSINGCFSGEYSNYRLTVNIDSSSNNTSVAFRLRSSGTDNSTSVYYTAGQRMSPANTLAGWSFGSTVNLAEITLTNATTGDQSATFDITKPNATARTRWHGTGSMTQAAVSNMVISWFGGSFDATTAFDGLTIFPNLGTFSGTIRVYGYKD